MLVLRADPWTPEFGMGFEPRADEPPATVDAGVESAHWTDPVTPAPAPEGPVWFVDGVRRVELRLLADLGERRAPGLFGSYAVGAVRCDGRASFDAHRVARAVVVGAGLRPDPVEVAIGAERLAFEPAAVTGEEPDAPLLGLQDMMRKAEGRLAASLASRDGELIVSDGPLTFFDSTAAAVVGVVKRTARRYLEPEHEALLGRLGPGQRTPVFALGDDERVRRYSWYARLVALRSPWHDHAGVVRCEVRAGLGVEAAARIADAVTNLLPRFAGRPSDPRAPQNLAPVGALESWLRHRMGHPGVVRRALTQWLMAREGET